MQNDSKKNTQFTLSFTLDSLLGFVGFACTVASFLGLFASGYPAISPVGELVFYQLAFALGMALAFVLTRMLAYRLSTDFAPAMLVVPLVSLLFFACIIFLGAVLPQLVVALFLVVVGMGISMMLCQWFNALSSHPHQMFPFLILVGFFAGLLIFLIECFLLETMVFPAQLATLSVAILCQFLLRQVGAQNNAHHAAVTNEDSDKRSHITRESAIMFSVVSFHMGFVLSFIVSENTVWCLLAALVAAALLIVDYMGKKKIGERSISRYTPPLTAFAYIGLFLFGPVMHVICLCLLTISIIVYTATGWAAMAEHVRLSNLSPLRVYAKARSIDYLSLMVGLLMGTAALWASSIDSVEATRICVVLAVVYLFLSSLYHKPRFPEPIGVLSADQPESSSREGTWEKRCRALAARCALSERQCDVLMLVAQGRSAKHIQQVLVISTSTAQTHIRNIYRKVGVHSREELINLIENTKLYGED